MKKMELFNEVQRFRILWVWLILVATIVFFLFTYFNHVFQSRIPMAEALSNFHFIFPFGVLAAIFILMVIIRLEAMIKKDGVYVRFFPFHRSFRYFHWNSIKSIHLRKYKPIAEFGGWGLRGLGKNRAYTMQGNMGLQIEFYNNKKLLIGTGKPDEMHKALEELNKA